MLCENFCGPLPRCAIETQVCHFIPRPSQGPLVTFLEEWEKGSLPSTFVHQVRSAVPPPWVQKHVPFHDLVSEGLTGLQGGHFLVFTCHPGQELNCSLGPEQEIFDKNGTPGWEPNKDSGAGQPATRRRPEAIPDFEPMQM
jgi:hypothetical protein